MSEPQNKSVSPSRIVLTSPNCSFLKTSILLSMIDFLSGSGCATLIFEGRNGIAAVGTLCKHAGLIFPEGAMKAASTAFRYNALAAAIEMGIRRFLHQGVKCLGRISCVHCLDLQFDKNKPRYCSAMRSAITGLCYTNYSVVSSLSRKLLMSSVCFQVFRVMSKLY